MEDTERGRGQSEGGGFCLEVSCPQYNGRGVCRADGALRAIKGHQEGNTRSPKRVTPFFKMKLLSWVVGNTQTQARTHTYTKMLHSWEEGRIPQDPSQKLGEGQGGTGMKPPNLSLRVSFCFLLLIMDMYKSTTNHAKFIKND